MRFLTLAAVHKVLKDRTEVLAALEAPAYECVEHEILFGALRVSQFFYFSDGEHS